MIDLYITYQSKTQRLTHGEEAKVSSRIPKLDPSLTWHIGIDGSSTAFGLAIYTKGYEHVHLFMFIRDQFETIDQFRSSMYQWLQFYLKGIPIDLATYERTPEGYKPPSSHAEAVMRDTEEAVRNFLTSKHYIMIKGKDRVFDIFPNSWKSLVVPKSKDNKGKVDKELNAISALEYCNLDVQYWFKDINDIPYKHTYDCFEALGIGAYGTDFIIKDDGTVRVYRNFTKIGSYLVVCKEVYADSFFKDELTFIGGFGKGKTPRMSSINENHSLPENLLGLADSEYNNILVIPHDHELSVYIRALFKFNKLNRDFVLMACKASMSKEGIALCKEYGYSYAYM